MSDLELGLQGRFRCLRTQLCAERHQGRWRRQLPYGPHRAPNCGTARSSMRKSPSHVALDVLILHLKNATPENASGKRIRCPLRTSRTSKGNSLGLEKTIGVAAYGARRASFPAGELVPLIFEFHSLPEKERLADEGVCRFGSTCAAPLFLSVSSVLLNESVDLILSQDKDTLRVENHEGVKQVRVLDLRWPYQPRRRPLQSLHLNAYLGPGLAGDEVVSSLGIFADNMNLA